VLKRNTPDLREKAFQTILRNRVQRGGILANGAGLIKTGESGRGLNSRWYPETLARRIREINRQKDRMTFVEGNGFDLIEEHAADAEAAFYIDPPYTVAARRLYKVWQIDHAKLFEAMAACRGDFLMSYDNTAEIVALAKKHGFESRPIAMKSTHHAKMTETSDRQRFILAGELSADRIYLPAASGCDGIFFPSFARNCSSNLSLESGTPPVRDFTDASSLVNTTLRGTSFHPPGLGS